MSVIDRWNEARSRIDRAAREAGRDPGSVTLVCVTKTFPSAAIVPLLEAGQRVFGENRVQEAREKWPELKARFPDIELHLLGPLQSNKVKEAVETFDVIQSLDREKIAARWRPSSRDRASQCASSCIEHGRRAAEVWRGGR